MARPTKDFHPGRYRIDNPDEFRLKDIDPGETGKIQSKEDVAKQLEEGVQTICELQEALYAQAEWSLLLVFQAMDTAGKDATIKHVLSGLNPQGCRVTSFKVPSHEELAHDFLWRDSTDMPDGAHIGVLNRIYYEEVLIARVHPDYLGNQHIPKELVTKRIWRERYES